MGSSKFWYYPNGGTALVTVNLGRTVTSMRAASTNVRQATATAWNGEQTTVQWGGVETTRIRVEFGLTGLVDRSVRRELIAMLNHMDRGGSVMFAVDSEKFFAGFLQNEYPVGDTIVLVTPFTEPVVAGVNIDETEIVIRSSNPTCKLEMQHVSAHSISAIPGVYDGSLTINPGITYDYSDDAWVLVRELGSWPALRLPVSERGREHYTTDYETRFVLDLPVEEDETQLARQVELVGVGGGSTIETPGEPILSNGAVGVGAAVAGGRGGWSFS